MRTLAIAFVLCGCVGSEDSDDSHPIGDDGHASITAAIAAPDDDAYDVCDHVPAEPPCSLICDYEALEAYVPERSCAVFACTLTDGRQVAVHACHPAGD